MPNFLDTLAMDDAEFDCWLETLSDDQLDTYNAQGKLFRRVLDVLSEQKTLPCCGSCRSSTAELKASSSYPSGFVCVNTKKCIKRSEKIRQAKRSKG